MYVDVGRLIAEVRDLDEHDLQCMQRWVQLGRREPTPLDRLWYVYRQLPAHLRKDLERGLLGG